MKSAKLILAVGGDESEEFHRQSEDQAKAWVELSPEIIDLPHINHFTIVGSLADPDGKLHNQALSLLKFNT